jgi:hypothetical protein
MPVGRREEDDDDDYGPMPLPSGSTTDDGGHEIREFVERADKRRKELEASVLIVPELRPHVNLPCHLGNAET